MTATDLQKYVQQSADFIEACRQVIHKTASERDALKEQLAKSSQVSVTEENLRKAANAIHTMYGNPSNITVDQIVDCWKEDPNTMANTISKLASERIEKAVTGSHIGTPIEKRSSAVSNESALSADEALWNSYK